jgi:hypothetical protein
MIIQVLMIVMYDKQIARIIMTKPYDVHQKYLTRCLSNRD